MTDHPRYSADDRAHWRSCTYDVAYAVDALLSWPLHTTRDLEAIRTQIQAMHPCHLDVALWNLA
ncbi:MAG TPA: hypothetical protein VFU23_09400, partial [Gemmatimonadales bacterium]|nr:hypothetical protein [Gemmatimonadales bacterium]